MLPSGNDCYSPLLKISFFFVSFPIKHGDFQYLCNKLPEGTLVNMVHCSTVESRVLSTGPCWFHPSIWMESNADYGDTWRWYGWDYPQPLVNCYLTMAYGTIHQFIAGKTKYKWLYMYKWLFSIADCNKLPEGKQLPNWDDFPCFVLPKFPGSKTTGFCQR